MKTKSEETPIIEKMSIEVVNKRIKDEICYDTIKKLSDENLMTEYMKCKSVKNKVNKLDGILDRYIDKETKKKIISEYLLELIPPGTKGVIRGNKFNVIVKNCILNLHLDKQRFEVCFEKKCKYYSTTEIPDWYITDNKLNKSIIGMNQLDIWGGGQQLNRGFKYITNDNNSSNSKLICVVCNEIQFKSKNNKTYKLFEIGYSKNTLCYLNNLANIVKTFFNLVID